MTLKFIASSLLLAVLSACGSSTDSATADSEATTIPAATSTTTSTAPPTITTLPAATTTSTTTTAMPAPSSPLFQTTLNDLAERGPFGVGVTTLSGDEGLTVEVWYPARAEPDSTDTYDIRDFVPDLIRDLLTGDVDAAFTISAQRDAPPDIDDEAPLVVFSHGFSGMRLQSALLTSHLASWGMVVASADHPTRDLMNVLAGTASGDAAESVDEVRKARAMVLEDDRFAGVDTAGWTAVGHSAGGGTIALLGAESDGDGLLGTVSLAAGKPEAVPAIGVPTMFIAGSLDAVVPPTASSAAFETAPDGSVLWTIDGAGHNAFDDFCRFGDGAGIIGVAEASGLGPLLEAQPQLRTLGTDGCLPPAAPVTDSDPAILAGVTAYLANLSGLRSFNATETPPGPLAVDITM
ncbi:MAG: hypothetical protein O2925_08190 [Actinomycetota bacterium]|nr:hypothetical protein [Actinomycetota bacterium]MDA3028765.1 hypothetical protein [Actinomycetota bacterium]